MNRLHHSLPAPLDAVVHLFDIPYPSLPFFISSRLYCNWRILAVGIGEVVFNFGY